MFSNQHRSLFTILVFVSVVLFLVPPTLRADTLNSFYQTKVNGIPQPVGSFDAFLTPSFASAVGFLNIAVDLNRDGPLTPNEWIIQNDAVPLLSNEFGQNHPVTLSTPFNVTAIGTPFGSYTVYESFTSSLITLSQLQLTSPTSVPFTAYDIGDLQDGTSSGKDAGGGKPISSGKPTSSGSPVLSPVDAAAATVIGRVRYDIPGILQGKNECAPTSAAQSLLWLKARYGDLNTLPAQNALITQLKTAMNFNDGIAPGDFVPGKKAVINKDNLRIVTVQGGQFNGTGTFDFIKKQIEEGEDVEMRIQYAMGGHWVTIAGWYDDGITQKLYFKDPLTGGDTVDEYVIDGTTIKNYKYGAGTISFAVAESIPMPSTFMILVIGLAIVVGYRGVTRRRSSISSASRAGR